MRLIYRGITVRDDLTPGDHILRCEVLEATADPGGGHEFRIISVMSYVLFPFFLVLLYYSSLSTVVFFFIHVLAPYFQFLLSSGFDQGG